MPAENPSALAIAATDGNSWQRLQVHTGLQRAAKKEERPSGALGLVVSSFTVLQSCCQTEQPTDFLVQFCPVPNPANLTRQTR